MLKFKTIFSALAAALVIACAPVTAHAVELVSPAELHPDTFRAQVVHMHADASRTASTNAGLVRDGVGYILRSADTPRVALLPA